MEGQKINDGGPAFPGKLDWYSEREGMWYKKDTTGMSTRMRIAIEAMKIAVDIGGTVSEVARELGIKAEEYIPRIHWKKAVAKRAFEMADAMIEASGEYK